MNYKEQARAARLKVLNMIFRAQTSHISSNFSSIDILSVLFANSTISKKLEETEDKIIISKGWVAAAFIYFLSYKGIIPKKDLNRFCEKDEKEYIGLLEPSIRGVPFAGGSVGMGLSAGVGYALSKQWDKLPGRVYVLEGDGGLQCGIVYESAMNAGRLKLGNLTMIIDNNGWCATGKTKDILNIEPIEPKFEAMGWHAVRINGHDYWAIEKTLKELPNDRPSILIADTQKGKGCSFMEADPLKWHYWHLNKTDYEKALAELH